MYIIIIIIIIFVAIEIKKLPVLYMYCISDIKMNVPMYTYYVHRTTK